MSLLPFLPFYLFFFQWRCRIPKFKYCLCARAMSITILPLLILKAFPTVCGSTVSEDRVYKNTEQVFFTKDRIYVTFFTNPLYIILVL